MKTILFLGLLASLACLTAVLRSKPDSSRCNKPVATNASQGMPSPAAGTGFNTAAHVNQSETRRPGRPIVNDRPSINHSVFDLAPYLNLLDELASKGVTGSVACEMVEARLHEDCNDQRAVLLAEESIPYWSHGYNLDEEKLAEFKAIDLAEWEAGVQLFGLDSGITDSSANWSSELAIRMGGPLDSKRQELREILGRFARERETLRHQADADGQPKDESVAMAKLEREMDRELGKVLTPTEREQYDLRNSPSANAVRSSLRDKQISVTEHEFRELYHARRKLDEALIEAAERGTDTGAAYEFYLANASRVLGPERMTLLD